MATGQGKGAGNKATAPKTPPSPQDVTTTTPAPVPAPDTTDTTTKTTDPAVEAQQRAMARAAQPTPAIAGVTAPAGPSSLTPVAPQQVRKPEPFLSEGMRGDLENLGYAIDPVSGARFDRDPETGEVTMRERVAADAPAVVAANWGKPTTIDVAFAPQPAANDTDKAQDVTSNPLVADQDVAASERPGVLDTGETLSHNPTTGVTMAHDPITGESREVSQQELQAAQDAQDDED